MRCLRNRIDAIRSKVYIEFSALRLGLRCFCFVGVNRWEIKWVTN